jgi:hypothetical protein
MPRESKAKPTLNVTQAIIDTATPKDSGHCMIADALKLALPEARRVSVDLATIRFSLNGKRYVYPTPRPAQVALLMFDEGVHLEPFKFRLHHALQITTTKGKRPGEGPERAARRKREDRAQRVANPSEVTKRMVPVVAGGVTPPIGPLAHGAPGMRPKWVTGRRREYGLRTMATRGVQ